MSARGPGAFYVNVDDDGALVLRGQLDIGTIQDLQDKIDDVMVPGDRSRHGAAHLLGQQRDPLLHQGLSGHESSGRPSECTPAVRRVLELADAKAEPEAWMFDGA